MWPYHVTVALGLAAERHREDREAARRHALARELGRAHPRRLPGRAAAARFARSVAAAAGAVARRASVLAARLDERPA